MYHVGDESVRGIIIGDVTFPYEFWTTDGQHKIAARGFSNDREAVSWFKKHYSDEYAQGAEMRCFDLD